MTALVLAVVALVAAAALVSVLISIIRALRADRADSQMRREGVWAVGTVVDNTMTSTPQRRLTFSPVVEFRTPAGAQVIAAAHQSAASSWARGSTVEVRYDPSDATRFVLASPPARGRLVANTIVGVLVVSILAGTVIGMYQVWSKFRYDQDQADPAATEQADPGAGR